MFLALIASSAFSASLSGSVVDESGEPLSGLTVYAVDHRLAYASAMTSSDGSWGIENLPEGAYRIWAIPENDVNHPSRFYPQAFDYCEGEPQWLAKGGELIGLDLALPEGGVVLGRVLDPDGEPLSGVEITAEGEGEAQGYRRKAYTDESGNFEVVGLHAPESASVAYTIESDLSGYPSQFAGPTYARSESALAEVVLGASEELGDLSLLLGQGVSGMLQSEGQPVSGANVFIYAEGQILNALSDEEGRFESYALPPGEVLVWASKEGHALTYFPDADRPSGTLAGVGEGELLDNVDLEMPVESALNLSFQNGTGDLSGVTVLAYNDTYTVGLGAKADESGEIRVGRLHPGDYAVFVYSASEGHLDDFVREEDGEVRWFEVGEEEGLSQDFEMPLGAVLGGHVYDEFGEPVYGAQVTAIPEDETLRSLSDTTDREGSFSISGVFPGPTQLRVSYTVYCSDDPGHVTTWWPDARLEERAALLNIGEGDQQTDLSVFVSQDNDHDGMGDSWETAYGLNPQRNDALEDPDGDGFTNLDEYLLGTDPTRSASDSSCGDCGGGGDALLWMPLGLWGIRRRRRIR